LRAIIAQLRPLMPGANAAEQTQFAMLEVILKTYENEAVSATPINIDSLNAFPGMSPSTTLVLRSKLAFKQNRVDEALALMAQAAKSTEMNEASQPLLFDDGRFIAMQPIVDTALSRFEKAGISAMPVPTVRAMAANAALAMGRMQSALDQFAALDATGTSPEERSTRLSSVAMANFWLGHEPKALEMAKLASEQVCAGLTSRSEICLRVRSVLLEMSIAAVDRKLASMTLEKISIDSIANTNKSSIDSFAKANNIRANAAVYKHDELYRSLLALPDPQATARVENLLLRSAQSTSRGRERFVSMRQTLSIAMFCERTNQRKLAAQARIAAIALSKGLQIPPDSIFRKRLEP
jgi:hypothetical protein